MNLFFMMKNSSYSVISNSTAVEKVIIWDTFIALSVVNVALHTVGLYVLVRLYRKSRRKTSQQLYLVCHCVIIILKNVLSLILVILEKTMRYEKNSLEQYLSILFGAVMYIYYGLMFYLTFDRLAGITLNFRYPLFWDLKKTKYLILSTAIFNVVLFICMSMLHMYLGEDSFVSNGIYAVYHVYIPTCLDALFLLLAVCTYSIMFRKYVHSRRKCAVATDLNNGLTYKSATKLLFCSRFKISLFIISCFLIFSVVPGLTYSVFELLGTRKTFEMRLIVYIMFKICDTAEAIVYVFCQQAARTILAQCFVRRRKLRNENVELQAVLSLTPLKPN